jgi:nucleoside 2-deoxyribosyltransferase
MTEKLYIAGPECFYRNGTKMLGAMRAYAESLGFSVTLPNDYQAEECNNDPRTMADDIFKNCVVSMADSTSIICDLECFRGPGIDGGSAYELGMAYATGVRCYGYTRDKREMKWKYQDAALENGVLRDRSGRVLSWPELPFSPDIIGSTKIAEGDFKDCIHLLMTDLEEERKSGIMHMPAVVKNEAKGNGRKIYLCGPERYDRDAREKYVAMEKICIRYGFSPEFPAVIKTGGKEDPYRESCVTLLRNAELIRKCDYVLVNLNDFYGYEPESDTSFECGYAFAAGKKMLGYMDKAGKMIDRVPNLGKNSGYRDVNGCNVENFDYPLNLMFASSMDILEGNFETAVAAADQRTENADYSGKPSREDIIGRHCRA